MLSREKLNFIREVSGIAIDVMLAIFLLVLVSFVLRLYFIYLR